MFEESISQETKLVLEKIAQANLTEKFYLAGGTALALQLGHSKVEDSLEFIEWIGLIKLKMERETEYESLLLSTTVSLPFSVKSD